MSGNITQRGDISIIDKWSKAEIALKYGVDLIVELPFKYASQSADIFAKGSINILKHIKVDKLIFGSESNNINLLTKIANTQLNTGEVSFDKIISEFAHYLFTNKKRFSSIFPSLLSKLLYI